MNEQKATSKNAIGWTRVWGRPGYTANPIRGCKHQCRWQMPNGEWAECYAKEIAEGFARSAYPNGFEALSFHPNELKSIRRLKEPAGIFLGSMSDLVGAQVPSEWIEETIQMMRDCPQHVFFILTKNPPRLKKFDWPLNAWLGVSAPPTSMFGKELTRDQQEKWYSAALSVLGEFPNHVTWTSIEPMSWDVSFSIWQNYSVVKWAVVGAASKGKTKYQPSVNVFNDTLDALKGKPVYFKENISRELANYVAGGWREEWPTNGL